MSDAKAARIHMIDGKILDGLTIGAVRPDSSALLVHDLPTPLGVIPSVVLRAEDVVLVDGTLEVDEEVGKRS